METEGVSTIQKVAHPFRFSSSRIVVLEEELFAANEEGSPGGWFKNGCFF